MDLSIPEHFAWKILNTTEENAECYMTNDRDCTRLIKKTNNMEKTIINHNNNLSVVPRQ